MGDRAERAAGAAANVCVSSSFFSHSALQTAEEGRGKGRREERTLSSESLPPRYGVVLSPREVHVPPLLEPLEELEVVLHLAAHEAVDGDGLSRARQLFLPQASRG